MASEFVPIIEQCCVPNCLLTLFLLISFLETAVGHSYEDVSKQTALRYGRGYAPLVRLPSQLSNVHSFGSK